MKAEVYYFTGTGNSLVVAKDIAKEIVGELISIPSVIGKSSIQTDANVLGIVFPVYGWGMPLIVTQFIKKLKNLNNKYIFAIATYAGNAGATFNLLEKVINNCNGKLAAGFTVHMPGNYTPMYGAIREKTQRKMFNNWGKKVKTVAEYIKSNQQGKKENCNMLTNLLSNLIYKSFTKNIPTMDNKFWADAKCNKCGICQKVCQVGNIEMIDGKPSWKGHCEQCVACLQWCPQTAIQFGQSTAKRKRYHHPNVTIFDIINSGMK